MRRSWAGAVKGSSTLTKRRIPTTWWLLRRHSLIKSSKNLFLNHRNKSQKRKESSKSILKLLVWINMCRNIMVTHFLMNAWQFKWSTSIKTYMNILMIKLMGKTRLALLTSYFKCSIQYKPCTKQHLLCTEILSLTISESRTEKSRWLTLGLCKIS